MDVDVEAEDVDAGGDPRSTMMLEEHQSEPTDEWQLRATPLGDPPRRDRRPNGFSGKL